jgi:general secretion pathway protein C
MNPLILRINNLRETDSSVFAKWSLIPILIVIAFTAAQLFWKIAEAFTTEQISTQIPYTTSSSSTTNSESNISKLLSQNIFGDASKVEVPVVQQSIDEDVPETRLNLKLRGIYASDDNTKSNAIIETSNGLQDLYFIDDSIPGERNLTLAKVLVDRIIIKRQGNFETLKMEDLSTGIITQTSKPRQSVNSPNKAKLIDRRNNKQLTQQLSKIKQQMVNDPTSLAGLMNVAPKTVNGEFIGFQISPGKDASLFARSGLRRNDIITNVNGIALNDPSSALTLIEEIRNADELSIELTRGDKPLSLVYNLNDNNK